MDTLCYSVRLSALYRISPKCCRAVGFDGSEALIPSRLIYGPDYSVEKSDAYWISAWILERKEIQYSRRKKAYFREDGTMLPETTTTEHIPQSIIPKEMNIINSLKK